MGFDMNYKIKVANEVKSKEAQELFFELGYTWSGDSKDIFDFDMPEYIVNWNNGYITVGDDFDKNRQEITLPELRDLVVLKRNDRKDANVSEDSCLYDLYLMESKELYFYHCGKKKWILSNLNGDDDYYKLLKPIEKKEMKNNSITKDYLEKQPDGSYVIRFGFALAPADWIEIPEGAFSLKDNFIFFNQDSSKFYSSTGEWKNTPVMHRLNILWQRESPNDKLASAEQYRQAEVLPFIDDDFAESDAWIESNVEQGLKHSHYKKDVSNLEVVDIYRLTELFKPHSCGAHIAKKALCSGNRGHKDLLTDIQDIIDTAERWKEMLIEDEIFDETEMPF